MKATIISALFSFLFLGFAHPVLGQAPTPNADFDSSGEVDATDLLILLKQWHQPTGPSIEMVDVPAGTFTMGRRDDGDDETYGDTDELPRHEVTLSAYQIGKFEVTNRQYAEVLNWANGRGYLRNSRYQPYTGGCVYANGQAILYLTESSSQISFANGDFASESREGYSMVDHPVTDVTWYGTVAFCNWLSEKEGRTPCYTLTTNNWNLTNRFSGGYRLPTEAEWERAAAWDGSKHWIYGFRSETLSGRNRCNYYDGSSYVNPLGLSGYGYTSPVGWYNGTNVSPNGNIQTVNSPSSVGCYDMSGNVSEWYEDWYQSNFYGTAGATALNSLCTNSISGDRVIRGGSWGGGVGSCRSAGRDGGAPGGGYSFVGFRVVVSSSP